MFPSYRPCQVRAQLCRERSREGNLQAASPHSQEVWAEGSHLGPQTSHEPTEKHSSRPICAKSKFSPREDLSPEGGACKSHQTFKKEATPLPQELSHKGVTRPLTPQPPDEQARP